jgi:hypothetical protein
MHAKFWSGNLKGRNLLENVGVGGKINIRMDLTEIGWEVVDWVHLAQDRDYW